MSSSLQMKLKLIFMRINDKLKNFFKISVNVKLLSLYDRGSSFFSDKSENISDIVRSTLSPTWWIAKVSNEGLTGDDRAKSLISRNYFYLFSSIFTLVIIGCFLPEGVLGRSGYFLSILLAIWLYLITWSRCNEILFSFISDALDKTDGSDSKSSLTYRKRIELALLSYVELIVNYSILYYCLPLSWFDSGVNNHGMLLPEVGSASYFSSIFDAIYFSGVTITTLGYGDFSPEAALPKLMVVHQVLVGFTLIVVSFAIYAGKGLSLENKNS